MARPLRIEYPGALYHVTSRGNARADIYWGDEDRRAWLDTLAGVCKRFGWRCHSWCQMTNHYHLVVETPEANLGRGMRQLNGVYTQYVNRAHGRVGHVFQGRYKAVLVQKEAHLLELARYVVLNPVRARMVADPSLWHWSAWHALVGADEAPPWLETGWLLSQFGPDTRTAVRRFMAFVRAGIDAGSIWSGLRAQIYLGDADFAARTRALLEPDAAQRLLQSPDIPRVQRRPVPLPIQDYVARFSADPKGGMAAAYESGDFTLQEVAEGFGVHASTVSRAVRGAEVVVCKT